MRWTSGDRHAEAEKPGRHRVTQKVRVDALGDAGALGDRADDLTDPLTAVDVSGLARSLFAAHEQRSAAAFADVQGKEAGEFVADRHLTTLAALAGADDHHSFRQADILDLQRDEFGYPCAGLEQGLHHQPDLAALLISAVDEAQLLLERQPVRRPAPHRWSGQVRLSPGLLEHRLGLQIVQPVLHDESGDLIGDALDVADHEFALTVLENKQACTLPRNGAS